MILATSLGSTAIRSGTCTKRTREFLLQEIAAFDVRTTPGRHFLIPMITGLRPIWSILWRPSGAQRKRAVFTLLTLVIQREAGGRRYGRQPAFAPTVRSDL